MLVVMGTLNAEMHLPCQLSIILILQGFVMTAQKIVKNPDKCTTQFTLLSA